MRDASLLMPARFTGHFPFRSEASKFQLYCFLLAVTKQCQHDFIIGECLLLALEGHGRGLPGAFEQGEKPLKRLIGIAAPWSTQLKLGVNERLLAVSMQ